MFGLALLSVSVGILGHVTLKLQANTHPPLATSPHQIGPSAPAPPNYSTCKNHTLHYINIQFLSHSSHWDYPVIKCSVRKLLLFIV